MIWSLALLIMPMMQAGAFRTRKMQSSLEKIVALESTEAVDSLSAVYSIENFLNKSRRLPKSLPSGTRVIYQSKWFNRKTADFIIGAHRGKGGQAHIYSFQLHTKSGNYEDAAGKVLRQTDTRNGTSAKETSIMKVLAKSQDERMRHLAVCEAPFVGRVINDEEEDDYMFSFCNDGGPITLADYMSSNHAARTSSALAWVDTVKAIMIQMLMAVSMLQDLRIIHADLKPHNVLMQPSSDRVTLCDFGAARILPRGKIEFVDREPSAMTAQFAAPEQFQVLPGAMGMHLNTDLFSIGLIVLWLLTGRVCNPFDKALVSDASKESLVLEHAERILDEFGFKPAYKKIYEEMKAHALEQANILYGKRYGLRYIQAIKSTYEAGQARKFLETKLLACQPAYEEVVKSAGLANMLDVLTSLLNFDPKLRPSAKDAIQLLSSRPI